MEAERNLAIERENKILLGKMYSIMNAEPAYKTHKARPHRRRCMSACACACMCPHMHMHMCMHMSHVMCACAPSTLARLCILSR